MNRLNLLKKIKFSEFVSLDLETTGLSKNENEIIEISALFFKDGKVVNEFTTLVKPNQSIPKNITNITSINDLMVQDSPMINDVLDDLLNFLNNKIIVGHNVGFDIGFLEQACIKNNKVLNFKFLCDTLSLSRNILFNFDKFNLEFLSNEFNMSVKNAHRARFDALNTGNLFLILIEQAASLPKNVLNNINKIINERDIANSLLFKNLYRYLDSEYDDRPIDIKLNHNILYNKYGDKKKFDQPINEWFVREGIFSSLWDNYKIRDSQITLANDIYDAFNAENNFIAEAGAGLGKSLAYLTSGLKYIKNHNKTLIISTYTKTLQNQLFEKDLPIFSESLKLNIKAVILKGKNNYISKNKLNKIINKTHINMDDKQINECITLIVWSNFTTTGDIEECNGFDKTRFNDLWSIVSYSSDNNLYNFNDNDYYSNVINESKNADIIIVNHSLLCSDLESGSSIIPDDSILVIDEGHNLVSSIRNHLTKNFNDFSFRNLFYNYIKFLNEYEKKYINSKINIKNQINITKNLNEKSKIFFDDFKFNYDDIYFSLDFNSHDINFNDSNISYEINFELLLSYLIEFEKLLKSFENEKSIKFEIIKFQSIINELKDQLEIILNANENFIKWISLYKRGDNKYLGIFSSDSNIKKFIINKFIKKFNSFFMCSATFSINNDFTFFLNKLGVNNDVNLSISTQIYSSPFIYEDQAKFYVYSKKIDINSSEYIKDLSNQIISVSNYCSKRILILCTSYKQVHLIGKNLMDSASLESQNIFLQTSKFSKNSILRNFKKYTDSILVGTSTFWEGVDLSKDLLEILLIVRIPFGNPSNPYNKHLSDHINSIGGNSFYDLELPNSILKIKQGIGRLIRSDLDNGVCFITDPRICNSRYGEFIINELPVIPESYNEINEIIQSVDNFLG